MRSLRSLTASLIFALTCGLQAAPLLVKDTKGREITISITDYNAKTVTFQRGAKTYTVPWTTFDEASIALIKKAPLPGDANKRKEREEEITLQGQVKKTVTVPAGKFFSEEGVLNLYPGDTVHLQFSGVGSTPKVVAEITKPENTITFKFTHDAGGAKLLRTMKIQKTVALDCYEGVVDSEEWVRSASVAPVEKGQKDEYAWPNEIWRIQIKNIELTEKSAEQAFRERSR
ncbi:hypothetical protein N9F61_00995 [Akkermansiaceae bacterium]|nr:hypothetical protein [Akkermansiaceae bacterium]MDB4143488.1 hypothetical protein [Akkermansiaceae bacterium]MDB4274952.1 hypothetical protein [Akkermansiaceae bacterium]